MKAASKVLNFCHKLWCQKPEVMTLVSRNNGRHQNGINFPLKSSYLEKKKEKKKEKKRAKKASQVVVKR